jgi:hypothetical protein
MAKKQGEGQKEILEECAVYAPTEGFEGKSKVTCGNMDKYSNNVVS